MNPDLALILIPLALGSGIKCGWEWGGAFKTSLSLLCFLLFLLLLIIPGFLLRSKDESRTALHQKVRIIWLLTLLIPFSLGFFRGGGARIFYERAVQASATLVGAKKELIISGTVVSEPEKWREGCRFVFQVETGGLSPRWEVFLSPLPPGRDRPAPGDLLQLSGVWFADSAERVTRGAKGICGGFLVRTPSQSGGMPKAEPGFTFLGRSKKHLMTAFAGRLRRKMTSVGERTLSPQSAGLLHGMLLGERLELSEQTRDGIRQAGVAHLFSVSGMHLIFWLSLFMGLGNLLRLPAPLLSLLSCPVVVVFLLLSGLRPPALRAGIMCLLGLVGKGLERVGSGGSPRARTRRINGGNLLAASACLTLLIRPLDLFSIGFYLSYLSCTAIFVFYPVWREALGKTPGHPVLQGLFLSTVIQIVLAPLLIRYFRGFSLLAPVANLVLLPFAAAALQIGLLSAVMGVFIFPFAQVLNAGNEVILVILRRLLEFCSGLPGYLSLPPWSWWTITCFYLALSIITWGVKKNPVSRRRRIPLFYILLSLFLPVLILVSGKLITSYYQPGLKLVLFDVGQGDSMLLSTSDGYQIMVDGGTRDGFQTGVKPYLRTEGITKIDLLVLTHPHEDHLGGVVALLEEDEVEVVEVMDSGYPHTTQLYHRFLQMVKEKEVKYHLAVQGSSFRFGQLQGVVLHPPRRYLSGTDSDINNNSLLLFLDYRQIRILLSGDLEAEGKENLLSTYQGPLKTHLLKVAHHGSKGAIHPEWLRRTRPEIALISVGRGNNFGHPSPQVIQSLRAAGARVYRTDQDGQLILEIIGRSKAPGRIRVKRGERR